MTLRLYDTASRAVRPFEPLEGKGVGVYGCGPTIYDRAHIGNFRTFVTYDLLHRYLEWKGFTVDFVVNLTDVDDKTIRGAAEAGVSLRDYTDPFAEAFHRDAEALGILPFDRYPRATEYVDRMIEFVQRLLDAGLAYRTDDGSVYFRIAAFPDYGRLSRVELEEGRSVSRVEADEYEKDDVRDFALWKGVREADEAVGAVWEAPWGRGRPGWHLECSVMGVTEVGPTLDIHLGGEDLVFPHHENEIAQSEGATGAPFVRYWLHIRHLLVEGRKMSKSLGNFFTVRELLERGYEPAAIRHQLLSAHYRSELNFTLEGLDASSIALRRLLDFESRLEGSLEDDTAAGPPKGVADPIPELAERALSDFEAALDEDLNSARALGALFTFVNEVNAALERGEGGAAGASAALDALGSMDGVLGLIPLAKATQSVDAETATWIESKIEERNAARAARDWARADEIRDELAERGFILEDTPSGTRWKKVSREAATLT